METNGNKLTKAAELLRQERETFDQQKRHDRMWFYLRLTMGYTAVIGLLSILLVCVLIIFYYNFFPQALIKWAGPCLFVDIFGLIFAVWRIVLNPNFSTKLEPITKK
jgi:hypothetical protein